MEDTTIKVVMLVSSIVTPILILLVSVILGWLKRDITVCVEDTKDCNKSIATLASGQASTDMKLTLISNRVDNFSKAIHEMRGDVMELKTRDAMTRGHD